MQWVIVLKKFPNKIFENLTLKLIAGISHPESFWNRVFGTYE